METKICLGCMQEIPANQPRCPRCGFSAADPYPSIALPLKTVLNERYVIGKPIRVGGDGITYIGYDLEKEQACIVREYLPQQMVQRSDDRVSIEIRSESLAPFKALLSDFNDLYNHMISWTALRHVRRIYDVIATNNTSYAISEYLEAVTLNRFLQEHGGRLEWPLVKKMFDPLFEELAMIHRSGYLHRAIAPENIMVRKNGGLVLISFTICSANVANSELTPNLIEGYASPEQYVVAQHGEWTDVYGLSAVLYRTLTGVRPQHAQTRQQNDTLRAPHQLNPRVPLFVSQAIMMGLQYQYNERLQNCAALRDALYYGITGQTEELAAEVPAKPIHSSGKTTKVPQDTAMTAFFDPVEETGFGRNTRKAEEIDDDDDDDFRSARRKSDKSGKHSGKKKKRPVWRTVVLWSIPIVALSVLLLYQIMIGFGKGTQKSESSTVSEESLVSAESSEVPSEPSAEPESKVTLFPVINFVGKVYDDLNLRQYTAFRFSNPQFEYNDSYDEGVVIRQSIEAGTEVEEGAEITLFISSGERSITLPDTKDYKAQQYADLLLSKYSIPSDIEKEYSDSVAAGKIIRVEPEAGSVYDRESGDRVLIVQSIGPDPTIEPEEPDVPEQSEEVIEE